MTASGTAGVSSIPLASRWTRVDNFAGRLAIFVVLTGTASSANAQRPSLSLDATLGTGGGQTTGAFLERRTQAATADATLAARLHRPARGGLIVAANATVQGARGSTDICVPAPAGGCVRSFPSFTMVGALGGWESARSVIRVAGGLAYARSQHGGGALALQGRIETALPVMRHLALVGSLRGTHMPNAAGARFSFFALGGGVRIY